MSVVFLHPVKTDVSDGPQGMEYSRSAERMVASHSWAQTTHGTMATRAEGIMGRIPRAQPGVPPDAHRRLKPSEIGAAASAQVSRSQGALANSGRDDFVEKVLEAALKKAKMQATAPPLEDQIALSVKFLERAKKRFAVADTKLQSAVKKKSQCEQEGAEAEADLARMRAEHSVSSESSEDPRSEVQQLQARLAQLEEVRSRHVQGSEEAAVNIRTKAARRRVGGCAEDVLPSTDKDLACWLDDKQIELRDALDMADLESASAITGLITRVFAKMVSFVPPLSTLEHGAVRSVVISRHGNGWPVSPGASAQKSVEGQFPAIQRVLRATGRCCWTHSNRTLKEKWNPQ